MSRISGLALTEAGQFTEATLHITGPEISRFEAGPRGGTREPGACTEFPPGYVIVPGLVDLHCHGAYGVDFPTSTTEKAVEAIQRIHTAGTTTLVASLVTMATENLIASVKRFASLVHTGEIAGIHLEGPFLSHARCGAQNPAWLTEPDLNLTAELIRAARTGLRTMTFAPELPGSADLIDLLVRHGVTPSIGHTASSTAVAAQALQGARCAMSLRQDRPDAVPTVTHLFNGMDPLHHRSPGALAACLSAARAGDAVVELIGDNVHLAPETVAMVFDLVGADNIALVTDSMAAAGLSDGLYNLGPSGVRVAGGVARLTVGDSIAGGTASMIQLVRNAVKAGVSLEVALHSATRVPARVLGLREEVGVLKVGARADLLVLTKDLDIHRVMRNGRWLDVPSS